MDRMEIHELLNSLSLTSDEKPVVKVIEDKLRPGTRNARRVF